MKKGDKKKQQKALKRRTEHKQSRRQENLVRSLSPQRYIRQARSYPLEGCWAQQGWDQHGLAVIVVARRQPNGNLVYGNYLVDYYCLGLKNTFCNADIPPGEFKREILPEIFHAAGRPISISPDLAHEIIYGSIEYAQRFGFRPQSDYRLSQLILDPPDAHPRTGQVEFGHNGKPFYIQGPHDNANAILRQLTRTVGEGNYHYMMPIGDPELDDWAMDVGEEGEQDTLDVPFTVLADRAQPALDELDIEIGDSIVVKPGILDPDTGQDIGGWQGRITGINPDDEEESFIVGIEWDSVTLNQMPLRVIEQCEQADLDWTIMNLDLREIEQSTPRDKPEDVIQAQQRIRQQRAAGQV